MEDASAKNPLEVPEILENILECLPLKDLKSSRLVNKLWRDCGIAPMKKKEKSGVWMAHAAKYPDKTIEDLPEFSDCLNSVAGGSANFPCSKFFLSLSLIRCENGEKKRKEDEKIIAGLLQKISPLATELWLSMSMDQEKRLFRAAFPRKVDFPKLKLLEVSTVGTVGRHSKYAKHSFRNLYQFVKNILEKAPSLQTVDLRDDEHSIDAIIKAKSSSFTELRLYAVKNASMEKLSKWNRDVKLKSLDLRFWFSEIKGTTLFQFLRSQSNSLETLVLYFSHFSFVSSPGILSFPEMPKLKNLTIQFYNDDGEDAIESQITFPVISYQRQFPELKALHLNPGNLQEFSLCQQFLKQDMQPFETLEELTLPSSDFDHESWITAENAVTIFPNVKKLEMMADSEMLPTIFGEWTNLEQLTLYPTCSCIDYMLMGYTCSGYNRLEKMIKMEGDDFDWNQLEPGNAESILNLQNLKVLRLINDDKESQELEVTRASLHLIMSRMGSLKCVDFGNRGYPMETKIDKAWWAELNEDCVVLWNTIQYDN